MRRLTLLIACLVGVTLGAQQPSADPPKPPERTLAACEAELTEARAFIRVLASEAEGERALKRQAQIQAVLSAPPPPAPKE